ncbi:uncharacterized protein LOC107971917 isoform X6 [Pan troglodytes]|uniref:uncharacterized protein LOC107971917 isoform X6 n=1 Tax=Pan troglodytes TaxID=9598 RepID=UPI00301415F6
MVGVDGEQDSGSAHCIPATRSHRGTHTLSRTGAAILPPPSCRRHLAAAILPPPSCRRHLAAAILPPPSCRRHLAAAILPPPSCRRHLAAALRLHLSRRRPSGPDPAAAAAAAPHWLGRLLRAPPPQARGPTAPKGFPWATNLGEVSCVLWLRLSRGYNQAVSQGCSSLKASESSFKLTSTAAGRPEVLSGCWLETSFPVHFHLLLFESLTHQT